MKHEPCRFVFIAHSGQGIGNMCWWGCIPHRSKLQAREAPDRCRVWDAYIRGTDAVGHSPWAPESFLKPEPITDVAQICAAINRVADELRELRLALKL